MKTRTRFELLILLLMIAAVAAPARAQVIGRTKQGARNTGGFLVGAAFEYTNDEEAQEFVYPFFAEYGLKSTLKLVGEWDYTQISSKVPAVTSASGLGDLETSVEWEFVTERRRRPALTVEFGVKWPTASYPNICSGETDYTAGLIASKAVRPDLDFDFGVQYTRVGDPPGFDLGNILEVSWAAEWEVRHNLTLEAELLISLEGHARGSVGSPGTGVGGAGRLFGGGGAEYELGMGVAYHLNDFHKFEPGIVIQPDLSWQVLLSWELDFTGGR